MRALITKLCACAARFMVGGKAGKAYFACSLVPEMACDMLQQQMACVDGMCFSNRWHAICFSNMVGNVYAPYWVQDRMEHIIENSECILDAGKDGFAMCMCVSTFPCFQPILSDVLMQDLLVT